MPVDQKIQQKVVELTSNASVNNKTKLAVRKRFYELKKDEVDLESIMDTFNDSVKVYEQEMDKILSEVVSVIPETVEPEIVTEPVEETERIIVPSNEKPGVKVRMQEELEDDNEEVEEVPYELSQD